MPESYYSNNLWSTPDLWMAVLCSTVIAVLLSYVRISNDAKVFRIGAFNTFAFFGYVLIFVVSNIFFTIVASGGVDSLLITEEGAKTELPYPLKGPLWAYYSFAGVFGFEAIVKGINLTFMGQGILSIRDWIKEAKNAAVARTIKRSANLEIELQRELAIELVNIYQQKGEKLISLAHMLMGPKIAEALVQTAEKNPDINTNEFIAFTLASQQTEQVKAQIKVLNR